MRILAVSRALALAFNATVDAYVRRYWPVKPAAEERRIADPADDRQEPPQADEHRWPPTAYQPATPTQQRRCWEDFSEAGRRVVGHAHQHAYAHHSDHVGTEHFLLALAENYDSAIGGLLQRAGVTRVDVRRRIEQAIGPVQPPRATHLPYSPHAKRALAHSLRDAQGRRDELIDVEHIVRGLFSVPDSAAARIAADLGVNPSWVSAGSLSTSPHVG
jgi:hypothetical protein